MSITKVVDKGAGYRYPDISWLFLHSPSASATTVTGLLTVPAGCTDCVVAGSESLVGIATVGRLAGDKLWLSFITARKLIPGATVAAGFAPLYLTNDAGVPQDIDWTGLYPQTNGRICVQLRTDGGISPSPCWQLVAGPEA